MWKWLYYDKKKSIFYLARLSNRETYENSHVQVFLILFNKISHFFFENIVSP